MRLRARPVVKLDRRNKARMIDAFLRDALEKEVRGFRILDIGCGNGDISAHFARNNFVVGVDVEDHCRIEHGMLLRCIARSEGLPFKNNSFDVVISHHVIEHVDDHDSHMREIGRVLASDGVCYLGTPNMSSPFMRGHVDNPMVLRFSEMLPLFERNGFAAREYYVKWLHEPGKYHCPVGVFRWVPVFLLSLMRRWFPSQCFVLKTAPQRSSR